MALASHVQAAKSRLPAAHTANAQRDTQGATTDLAPYAGRGSTRARRETLLFVTGSHAQLDSLVNRRRQQPAQPVKLTHRRPTLGRHHRLRAACVELGNLQGMAVGRAVRVMRHLGMSVARARSRERGPSAVGISFAVAARLELSLSLS